MPTAHSASSHSNDALAGLQQRPDRRVLLLCALAVPIGAISALVAKALIWLIAVITNAAFFLRWSSAPVTPAENHLGWWAIVVPVVGSLLIGLMARYGSEKIRGHGIPEALEAILLGRSLIDPKVAILKPVSSAISDRRHWRPLRRRGTDHHDRRRVRLNLRPVVSSFGRGAEDPARRGRGGRYGSGIRHADRRRPARGGTAPLRMETPQFHPRGRGRDSRGDPRCAPAGRGPDFPAWRRTRHWARQPWALRFWLAFWLGLARGR